MTPVTYMLHEGDCLEWLRSLPSDSVDSCVTDPPYGLSAEPDPAAVLKAWLDGEEFHHKSKGFMNKQWDSMVPGPTVWKEIHRVLKPGGVLLAFAGTRTWDLMSMAIRLAGFENRDTVRHDFGVPATSWGHGQGFPKGKSQFKPAWEPILVFRKSGPLREYRIDECRISHSEPAKTTNRTSDKFSGVLNGGVAGHFREGDDMASANPAGRWPSNAVFSHTTSCVKVGEKDVKGTAPVGRPSLERPDNGSRAIFSDDKRNRSERATDYSIDGKETVADWRCAEGCPVRELDAQSGVSKSGKTTKPFGTGGIWSGTSNTPCGPQYGDKGGSSRFFHQFPHDPTDPHLDLPTFIYQAKASRSERERGCEGPEVARGLREGGRFNSGVRTLNEDGVWEETGSTPTSRRNTHVSVKPLALMRHLCRLVTPVGGTVLDPFAGSGTTGCAAMLEGLSFLGAEREAEYVAIARARIGYYFAQSNGVSDGGATRQKSNVAQQKKSNVAQQNATKLRTLRNLPKRTP